jgi:hypothetical protein
MMHPYRLQMQYLMDEYSEKIKKGKFNYCGGPNMTNREIVAPNNLKIA